MPLHPISVVNHVLDEYRSYLRTEFRARDPKLRAALEEAIDTPLFLASCFGPPTPGSDYLAGIGRPIHQPTSGGPHHPPPALYREGSM